MYNYGWKSTNNIKVSGECKTVVVCKNVAKKHLITLFAKLSSKYVCFLVDNIMIERYIKNKVL